MLLKTLCRKWWYLFIVYLKFHFKENLSNMYTQKPKRGRIVNIISSQCVNTNSTVMAMNHPSVDKSLSDDSGV